MPIRTEDFHTSLYDLLKTKGYNPIPLDSTGKTSPFYPEADIFKFTFTKDGKSYGDVWATVDNALKLVLYYDDDVASSPEGDTSGTGVSDSWFGLLKHLKKWAQRRQLGFELKNKDHLVPDMQQREYSKKKERLGEAYHPMGKKASYNDAIPQVKIVIQHNKQLGEGEQRYRNVEKIFVENTQGERFAVPTKKPGLAKIYARHVAEGGTPYDERGRHLTTLIEEYTKMVGFMRATKNGEFAESVQKVVEAGTQHYQSLKETLHRLVGHKGYHNYFDSWTPILNEEQTDDTVSSLFVQQKIDPRIESCIPILSRIAKLDEVKQVDKLSDWAEEVISETTGIELPAMMPGSGKNTRTKRAQDRKKEEVLAHLKKQQALSHYGKELEKAKEEPMNEVNPHNYDSDVDYYKALGGQGKKRRPSEPDDERPEDIDADIQDRIDAERRKRYEEKGTTVIDSKTEGEAPAEVPESPKDLIWDRKHYDTKFNPLKGGRYNGRLIIKSDDTNYIRNQTKRWEDSEWGAKTIVQIEDKPGERIVYFVDNHKYGRMKPWKDEESTQDVSEGQLNEYAALLAAAARLLIANAPRIAAIIGRTGAARAAGTAATSAGTRAMLNATASEILIELTKELGSVLDKKTIQDLAKVASEHKIPLPVVLSVIYGGKKAIDKILSQPAPATQQGVAEGDESVIEAELTELKDILKNAGL